MHTRNIAIIGHGNVGRALATNLRRRGHDVVLAGRAADRTLAVATELGVRAATSPRQAAAEADIVILAIPFAAGEDVARQISEAAANKIVIDVTNTAKPDFSGLLFEGRSSGAEEFAKWLPKSNVVKAFNTLFASNMADPTASGVRLDGFVAADDETAKATVLELVTGLGLVGIDAGPLASARYLEAMAWLNIQINASTGGDWRSAWKLVSPPAAALRPAA